MVPPFYASWAKAPRARTAREAPSIPSKGVALSCSWGMVLYKLCAQRAHGTKHAPKGLVIRVHSWYQDAFHILLGPISLWDIHKVPRRSKFAFRQGFLNFWSNAPKCCYLGGGGGGMWMLFESCAKRPSQKCMGWGGGYVVTILSTEL